MAIITTIKERINALSPGDFQILCDAYLLKEGYSNIMCLGTQTGARRTTKGTPDTYFCDDIGKYIFVEYTTQKENLFAKINLDIDKCLDIGRTGIPLTDIAEIIYCHTSSNLTPQNDRALRIKCEGNGIKLTLIGIDKIASDIYEKYKTLAKDHLNLFITTEQIQPLQDFVERHDRNSLVAPLSIRFMFRSKELLDIKDAFYKSDVVLLKGSPGTGKTRIAIHFAETYKNEQNGIVYCIHNRALPIYDDLCAYMEKPGKYFILVDDANEISNLNLVLDYANRKNSGYEVKILMTIRDYAVEKVKSTLEQVVKYEIVDIKPFSDLEIKEIVSTCIGIKNDAYLKRIVNIANGNPRLAILASNIAGESNRLDSIYDVSKLYSAYYGRVLKDSELSSNTDLLKVLGIMALIDSMYIDKIDMLKPFLSEHRISEDSFRSSLYRLHELELIDIYFNKAAKFAEQSFANFILKYVFYDSKIFSLSRFLELLFSRYESKIIYAINTLVRVFKEDKLIDFVQSEIRQVWIKLKAEKSSDFMDLFKKFYPVDLTEALLILNDIIDNEPQVEILVEKMDTETGKNYINISDDIINILGGFANTDALDSSLDLFFKYYLKRPDMYMQFYHASIQYFGIDKNSYLYNFYTVNKYIQKITEYSDCWKNKYICYLFLNVAEVLLGFRFNYWEDFGRNSTATMTVFYLSNDDNVEQYRRYIWEQISLISAKKRV